MKRIFLFTTLLILFLPFQVWAADYYVRPLGGSYGLEDGTSYANAWDGFVDITWATPGSGDTLYICSTHTENMEVAGGGNIGGDLTISGDETASDCVAAGVINGQVMWAGSDVDYVTLYDVTINGEIEVKRVVNEYDAGSCTFSDAAGTVTCAGADFVNNGVEVGQLARFSGSSNNDKRYLLSGVAATVLTVDESGVNYTISDETVNVELDAIWLMTHVTIENCVINSDGHGGVSREIIFTWGMDYFTIKNNEIDGNNYDFPGAIYPSFASHAHPFIDLVIEGNYIHDIGGANQAFEHDAHCIGIQMGNGLTITKNHLKNCGAGIIIYTSATKYLENWEITYNYIENMTYSYACKGIDCVDLDQWPGSGIIFTASDDGAVNDAGLLAYNVIVDPVGCQQDENWRCVGLRTKWGVLTRIYGNVLDGNDYNLRITDDGTNPSVDLRNNISLNPNVKHLEGPGDGNYTAWTEDNNIYYPNVGTLFSWDGDVNFSDYNTANPEAVNANSSTTDPDLNADYTLKVTSLNAINVGADLGETYDDALDPDSTWPNAVTTLDQDDYGIGWEIGAFVFEDEISTPKLLISGNNGTLSYVLIECTDSAYNTAIQITGTSNTLENCTVYKSNGLALDADESCTVTNTILEGDTQDIDIAVGKTVTAKNNNLHHSINATTNIGAGTYTDANSVFAQDPLFRAAGLDFHLQAGSPAKNAGFDTGADTDLDGRVTPVGIAHDIGAYELGRSGGSMGMGLKGYCPHRADD